MQFSESIFASVSASPGTTWRSYLGEALSQGGDYADLYFEYLATSSISIDESIVKSATQGVTHGRRRPRDRRRAHRLRLQRRPVARRRSARPPTSPRCIAAGPAKVEKSDLERRPQAQSLSRADRAHRDGLRRARRTGEARRPRRARLRSAHVSGAGDLCRQPAPRAGRDQRRRADLRSPADGPHERLRAGARRTAALRSAATPAAADASSSISS